MTMPFPTPEETAALIKLGAMRTRLVVTVSMIHIAITYQQSGLNDHALRLLTETYDAQKAYLDALHDEDVKRLERIGGRAA